MARDNDSTFCERESCKYFKRFYDTVSVGRGVYTPNFAILERCTHPSVGKKVVTMDDVPGENIQGLRSCPKNK